MMTSERRSLHLFFISSSIRLIGTGIFNALFNIYFLESGFTESFLGIFLAIGNIAMAIASYPSGILIDRFSKKTLMLLFTAILCLCYYFQTIITFRPVLLLISFIFGIAFIGLNNLTGPTLYSFKTIQSRFNLFSIFRFTNIVSITIGATLAGFCHNRNIPVKNILYLSAILGFISMIPQFFMAEIKSDPGHSGSLPHEPVETQKSDALTSENPRTLILILFILSVVGFSPMIINYINVYLQLKTNLDIDQIAFGQAGIHLVSGSLILLFSKYKIKDSNLLKSLLIFSGFSFLFFTLIYLSDSFILLVSCLTGLIWIFDVLFSLLNDFIFSATKSKDHGKYAGLINLVSNFSETAGILLCGWLIQQKSFIGIYIGSTIPVILFILITAWGAILHDPKMRYNRYRQPSIKRRSKK